MPLDFTMKKIFTILSLLLTGSSIAPAQVNFVGVYVQTNGTLIAPTNFFNANSNVWKPVVSSIVSGLNLTNLLAPGAVTNGGTMLNQFGETIISSNNYSTIAAINQSGFNAFNYPPNEYNSWSDLGSYQVDTNGIFGLVRNFGATGLGQASRGGFYFNLGDAGISTNLDARGLVQIDTNQLTQGLQWMHDCIHSNGMLFMLTFEATSATGPSNIDNGQYGLNFNAPNLYQNATNRATWPVDGFRFETAPADGVIRFINAYRSCKYANPYVVFGIHGTSAFGTDSGATNSDLGRMPPGTYFCTGGGDGPLLQRESTNLAKQYPYPYQIPGRWTSPNELNCAPYLPNLNNNWAFMCLYGGQIREWFQVQNYQNYGNVWRNPELFKIQTDPMLAKPIVLYADTNYEAVVKPMSDGGCVLALFPFNTAIATNFSYTFKFANDTTTGLTNFALLSPTYAGHGTNENYNSQFIAQDVMWQCQRWVDIFGNTNVMNFNSQASEFMLVSNSYTLTTQFPAGANTNGFITNGLSFNNQVAPVVRLYPLNGLNKYLLSQIQANTNSGAGASIPPTYNYFWATNFTGTNTQISLLITNTGIYSVKCHIAASGFAGGDNPALTVVVTNGASGAVGRFLANQFTTQSGSGTANFRVLASQAALSSTYSPIVNVYPDGGQNCDINVEGTLLVTNVPLNLLWTVADYGLATHTNTIIAGSWIQIRQ